MIRRPDDIEHLKRSGKILATVMDDITRAVVSGITTKELDQLAEERIRDAGGESAFKGYRGYPATLCTSLNEEIVHTIPSEDVVVMDGDILKLDLGVRVNGWNTDMAVTVGVGEIDEKARTLMRVTEEALTRGVAVAAPDGRIGDISHAIQEHVEAHGFMVVRTLFGHGVGQTIHEPPQIPNFGKAGTGDRILPGMVLAIEPITVMGDDATETRDDGWSIIAIDGSLAAHFEHTVLITEDGAEIVTRK